jgi:hypothetical protein
MAVMTEEEKKAMYEKMKKAAIGLAAVYAVYKYGKFNAVKAAALGVGGMIVAKQVPYIKDVV